MVDETMMIEEKRARIVSSSVTEATGAACFVELQRISHHPVELMNFANLGEILGIIIQQAKQKNEPGDQEFLRELIARITKTNPLWDTQVNSLESWLLHPN